MASFDFDESAIDDLMEELNTFEVDCPECDRSFEISVDDIGKNVTCPHCKTNIKIESE